ncbi:MAG: site-2 protease family protein [Actinobacteria bacterium]|nr:MAG: site-2 protease family protein [Actinomycetota bacterium]
MIPRKGFRVARFGGVSVYLHWSWFIVFFILLWVVVQFFQINTASSPALYIPMAVVTTFFFFVSVLLHELSHSIVANRNGVPIKRITLFVFGGVAQMGRDVPSPGVEFKMAAAGPLCSYALSLLFGGAAYLSHTLGAGTVSFGFMLLCAVNFGLGTFNLIPGFPLDGGRILRSMLWHHWGDLERSTRTASRLGEGVGGLLIVGGVALIILDLFQAHNDLLFASVWFILIGTFLVQAAAGSYRQVRLRVSLADTMVRELIRSGVPAVDSSTTLEEVYRLHLEMAPTSTVPVLRQGKLAAAIRFGDVRSVDPVLWSSTPAQQVARPVSANEIVTADTPLFEAMLVMERTGKEFLWVVEEGRLLGVLFRDDARRVAKQSSGRGRVSA